MEKLELQKIANEVRKDIRADLYQQQIYSHICILKK